MREEEAQSSTEEVQMSSQVQTCDVLKQKHCVPCEGGVPPLRPEQAVTQLRELPGWELSTDGKSISKTWKVKDFRAAMQFFEKIADVAERENHHPDLHLEGYRRVTVVLTTHAIGGLSDNDLIIAAKIEDVPVELKT